MKTTIEIPDALFREAKAMAALRGRTLRALFTEALEEHLRAAEGAPGAGGWRLAFGRARPSEVAEVDSVIASDLERIDLEDWR